MTAEEERLLIVRAQGGDIAARNELITTWMDLVYKTARKHMFSGMDIEDMAQEGVFGLIRAINKFDLDKGFRFSTYAKTWVTHFMHRAKINKYTLVRKPIYLYAKKGDREAISIESSQSIDATNDTSHGCGFAILMGIADYRGDVYGVDDADENAVRLESIPGAIAMLSDIEAKVIDSRFGLKSGNPESLKATAATVGVCARSVQKIERRAMAKLRKAIRV